MDGRKLDFMEDPLNKTMALPPADDLTGTHVDRYEIRSRLGTGGMGEVYLAEDTKLKRAVALKRLAPQLRSNPRSHLRFLREAQRASALNHPHIGDLQRPGRKRRNVSSV